MVAKTSVLFAFVTVANISENSVVNTAMAQSFALGSRTESRTRMESMGKSDDKTVLTMLATAMKGASS